MNQEQPLVHYRERRNGPHNPTNRFFEPLPVVIESAEEDERSEEVLDHASNDLDDNSQDEIID